jgi:hypothetical protein
MVGCGLIVNDNFMTVRFSQFDNRHRPQHPLGLLVEGQADGRDGRYP